jgi:DNA-binding Lrp family transcriptional regulator
MPHQLDPLDLTLIEALTTHPRSGPLELSRLMRVARATVAARLQRLEDAGVITGYGPDVELVEAGFPVRAFVTLEIAQGGLGAVADELAAIPNVLEAHAVTGTGDIVCHVAARSHADLQDVLVALNSSAAIVRSTSVIALSTVVPHRVLPLLRTSVRAGGTRAPHYR